MDPRVVTCFDKFPKGVSSFEETKKTPTVMYLCRPENTQTVFKLVISRLRNLNDGVISKIADIARFYEYLLCIEGPDLFPTIEKKPGSSESPYKEIVAQIFQLCDLLYQYSCVGIFIGREGEPFIAKDFTTCPDKARLGLKTYDLLLTKLRYSEAMDENEPPTLKHSALNEAILHGQFYLLMLTVEHVEPNLWTSSESLTDGQHYLKKIMKTNNMASIQHQLCSCSTKVQVDCDLVRILKSLEPRFEKVSWKSYPTSPHVYTWCLFNVKIPFMEKYIGHFMPPALVMADDCRMQYKLLGIKCFNHIIEYMDPAILKESTHAHVMYDCLQTMTFTHKAELLKELHPCLLRILAVIEKNPKRGDEAWREFSRYDVLFQRLINDMHLETRLDIRRQHSEYLPQYVEVMGITVVKHLKRYLQVVENYLHLEDSPRETTRINILKSLAIVIFECWPRIPNQTMSILKILTTLLIQLESADKNSTKVKKRLTDLTLECLELLRKCAPEQYQRWTDICKDHGMSALGKGMKYLELKSSE